MWSEQNCLKSLACISCKSLRCYIISLQWDFAKQFNSLHPLSWDILLNIVSSIYFFPRSTSTSGASIEGQGQMVSQPIGTRVPRGPVYCWEVWKLSVKDEEYKVLFWHLAWPWPWPNSPCLWANVIYLYQYVEATWLHGRVTDTWCGQTTHGKNWFVSSIPSFYFLVLRRHGALHKYRNVKVCLPFN